MAEVQCIHGRSTDNPCPRPGTVEEPGRLPGGVKVCEVHAALAPLFDQVDALAHALTKLGELEEWAREYNNGPLFGLVVRARAEFTERLQFLEKHADVISLAGS